MRRRRSCPLLLAVAIAAACSAEPTVVDTATDAEQGPEATTSPAPSEVAPASPSPTPASTEAPQNVAELLCEPVVGTPDTVLVAPPWDDGVVRNLEVRHQRQDPNRPTPAGETITPVVLTASTTDAGHSFVWVGEPTLANGFGLSEAQMRQSSLVLEQIPNERIRYRLDASGRFLGVENVDELRADLLIGLDVLADALPGEPRIAEARVAFERVPDDQIEQLLTESPQLLHSLEGVKVELGVPVEFDDLLVNTFGGQPFPARTSVQVAELVDDDGCVVIESQTTVDPLAARAVVLQSMRDLLGEEPPDGLLDDAIIDITNSRIVQLDLGSGFLRSIRSRSRTQVAGEMRIEERIVTDVTDR